MSNKSRLQTNNTNLQALINKANTLPEAGGGGGGGSIETVTVTYSGTPEPGCIIYYLNGEMSMQQAWLSSNGSYSIAKGSIFVIENYMASSIGGCTAFCGTSACKAFLAIPYGGGSFS